MTGVLNTYTSIYILKLHEKLALSYTNKIFLSFSIRYVATLQLKSLDAAAGTLDAEEKYPLGALSIDHTGSSVVIATYYRRLSMILSVTKCNSHTDKVNNERSSI